MRESKQEIFNKAFLGLRSQGFKQSKASFNLHPEPRCAYRGSEGRKCALGWCITDEEYTPAMEGSGPGAQMFQELFLLDGPYSQDTAFLQDLQACHDKGYEPESMERHLRKLASQHNLTIPE